MIATRPVRPAAFAPRLPGDKSITHRAYLLAALAAGEYAVHGANSGADCEATRNALGALGVTADRHGDTVRLVGAEGRLRAPAAPLDLGNSGTGLRLLLGVLAGRPVAVELTGDASLRRRPMERVLDPLRRMGATAIADGGRPPVRLAGGALRGITWRMETASAQVKSALLLAGVQATGETVVEGAGASRDHTERMLRHFGVAVDGEGDRIAVAGPAVPRAADVRIPGDPSAATFWLVLAGLVPGASIRLEGVLLNPLRTRHFDILRRMGLRVEVAAEPGEGPEPSGRVEASGDGLRRVDVDPEEIPAIIDELPALAVAAAFADGTTRIRGAGELRVKESDRLAAVADGLDAIGARVERLDDGWRIHGSAGAPLRGGVVETRGDHRIAMAFLIAGFACRDGVRPADPGLIETSDPHFPSNVKEILETTS